jgi:hypothetical protein
MRFNDYINEAGEGAGKMELVKTNVEDAYNWTKEEFAKKGQDIDKEMPDFKKNYQFAKKQAGGGKTQRKDMPVIDEKDIKHFQKKLKGGYIDNEAPFADDTNAKDPFPKGLSGTQAQEWLNNGLEPKDGTWPDDKIKATLKTVPVGKLKPIQKQIYADKSLGITASSGVSNTKSFLDNHSTFVISKDNFIIDGHHRYLSALMIDPKMPVNVLVVEAPIKKLLPLSLSYSDAVGNRRNA